jgi:hypothetical protein
MSPFLGHRRARDAISRKLNAVQCGSYWRRLPDLFASI